MKKYIKESREIIATWTTMTLLLFKEQVENSDEKENIKEFIQNALYCITEIQKNKENENV